MKILSVDPSIDPKNFGWALFDTSLHPAIPGLINYGIAIAGRMAKGQNRYYTLFNFGLGHSGYCDYLIIDWPAMTPYAKRSRNGHSVNFKSMAMNHQSIGAFLAGMQMDDERIIRWNSAKHTINKQCVKDLMISQYRLPSDTPDHITDAIYHGEWLSQQLRILDFKTIQEMEK